MNEATRDVVIRRTADTVLTLLHQRKADRLLLERVEDLMVGTSFRALAIYGLTGLLSSLFGTLLALMLWRLLS